MLSLFDQGHSDILKTLCQYLHAFTIICDKAKLRVALYDGTELFVDLGVLVHFRLPCTTCGLIAAECRERLLYNLVEIVCSLVNIGSLKVRGDTLALCASNVYYCYRLKATVQPDAYGQEEMSLVWQWVQALIKVQALGLNMINYGLKLLHTFELDHIWR